MDFVEVPVSEDVPSAKRKVKKQKKQKKSGEKADEKATEQPEPTEAPDSSLPPTFSLSEIKNKQRRHLMFMKFKQEKRKVSVENL